MTPKRLFFVIIAINSLLLILLVTSVILGNRLINQQSGKLAEAKVQSKIIEDQQIQLNKAKKDVEQYKDLNDIVKTIVPQDKDQAKTVLEISKIAEESGIKLSGIAFESSSLGQTAAPSASGQTSTPTPTPGANALSQVKPVKGISGVYSLEIIVTSLDSEPVPYNNFLSFLEKLEANRRTAHVNTIVIKPDKSGQNLSFALTLNAYLKP